MSFESLKGSLTGISLPRPIPSPKHTHLILKSITLWLLSFNFKANFQGKPSISPFPVLPTHLPSFWIYWHCPCWRQHQVFMSGLTVITSCMTLPSGFSICILELVLWSPFSIPPCKQLGSFILYLSTASGASQKLYSQRRKQHYTPGKATWGWAEMIWLAQLAK